MRILFVCAAGRVAGKEKQTLALMKYLRGKGHDVYCAMSAWNDGGFQPLLTEAGIPFDTIRLGFISVNLRWDHIRMTLHQLIYVPYLWWKYRSLLRKWKPEVVVHCSFEHLLVLGPVLGRGLHVFHVHDVFPVSSMSRRLFRRFNSNCQRFVGVSKFVCQNLIDLGVQHDKIAMVYNGVELPKAPFVRSPSGTRVNIGIAGQLGPWKGHDVLLDALAQLKAYDWRLFIIGTGSPAYQTSLEEKIRASGIEDRVEFTGHRSGLQQIYGSLDLVCVPSLVSEAFGLAAAEPGFFGLPVIASNLGGLPEVVLDGTTGLTFTPGDSTALAAAIESLVKAPERMVSLGNAARDRAHRLFSISSTGNQMESILQELRDGNAR